MEDIYQQIPINEIPWDITEPPEPLVELVTSGKILPCKTVDLGCGSGNYSLFLAKRGFEVTGIDISPTAIKMAKEKVDEKGVTCDFIAGNLLDNLNELTGHFDFAFDWEVLHHIFPDNRKRYIKNVLSLLRSNALYFSVCFSEKDPQFGGSGKFRKTPIGTTLYFSSEEELEDLFTPYFKIDDLKTIEIKGKRAPHLAVYALMSKKVKSIYNEG
jgi:cyclopropane fatty-acyl-phospholipid synthase-like methyltransferase